MGENERKGNITEGKKKGKIRNREEFAFLSSFSMTVTLLNIPHRLFCVARGRERGWGETERM